MGKLSSPAHHREHSRANEAASHLRHSYSIAVYRGPFQAHFSFPHSTVFVENPRLSVKFPVSHNQVDTSCRAEIDGPLSLADTRKGLSLRFADQMEA